MKTLETLLKKYEEIGDFIIFGSTVKGKAFPEDIDIAVLTADKNMDIAGRLKQALPENIHLEFIKPSSLLKTRLSLNLIAEGYSIRKKTYLRNVLGITPVKLFIYNLQGFSRSKKALFSMALTKTIKEISGRRIAPGAVIIPIEKTGFFDDFLDNWQIKYKTEEHLMF